MLETISTLTKLAEEYEDAESRWIRSVQIEMQSESGYEKRGPNGGVGCLRGW